MAQMKCQHNLDPLWQIPTYYAVRDQRYLYVHWLDDFNSREYYPGLDTNFGAEQLFNFYPVLTKDDVTYLETVLSQLIGCQGDACRASEDQVSPQTRYRRR